MSNLIKYIKFNNQYIKLHEGEFDRYSVIKGEAYRINTGEIYIYRGKYIEGQSNAVGLYIDADNEFIAVGDPEINDSYIIQHDTTTSNLLNNIKNMPSKNFPSDIEKPASPTSNSDSPRRKKTESKTPEKRKLNNTKRMKRDQPLQFTINKEDDPMVRVIKERINSSTFTMEDIYNAVENETTGYNLFYGLLIRPNMNWKSFITWCDILGVEPILTIRDKD